MDLIEIRSQNKRILTKYDFLSIEKCGELIDYRIYAHIGGTRIYLGIYKTEERALEVLDEIQKLIKNQYIVECKSLISKETIVKAREDFINNYSGEFIMQPPPFEIHPINPYRVVYEMPEE